MTLSPTTAVLLDRFPLWLDAVEVVLARWRVRVVGKATRPDKALALIDERRPGLFVAEIGTARRETDGIAVLHRAREIATGLKIIVLSHIEEAERVDAAFAAGASAYVVKTADPEELGLAVRQTLGMSVYGRSVYFAGNGDREEARPQADGPVEAPSVDAPRLTARELEILRLVADGHSNAQLARMLWVTEQTVKFHLSNIYRKIGVSNRTEAGRWAHLHNLLPEPPAQTSAA